MKFLMSGIEVTQQGKFSVDENIFQENETERQETLWDSISLNAIGFKSGLVEEILIHGGNSVEWESLNAMKSVVLHVRFWIK